MTRNFQKDYNFINELRSTTIYFNKEKPSKFMIENSFNPFDVKKELSLTYSSLLDDTIIFEEEV